VPITEPTYERYPTDVIKFSNANNRIKLHPTEKPIDLLEYLIKTYTNEGDTVLDFCMGSGSTGIACLNTNRNFIGIELDDHYFEVAKERIEAHEKSIADGNSSIHNNVGTPDSTGKTP